MIPSISLRRALEDPALLGNSLPGPSWATWRALLLAARGEALNASEHELVRAVIGDRLLPNFPVRELAVIAGRRCGKDVDAAVLGAYLGTLIDYRDVLRPGERGTVLCIAADTAQAKVTKGYIQGVLEQSPVLSAMVKNITQDEIELTNGIVISVRAASYRRLRGLTCVACIASEVAFWIDSETSANPADEILKAVRPSLITTAGPLVLISSPHAKSGPLYEIWRNYFGKDDPEVLVAQAQTRVLNPTIPQSEIDAAMRRDPMAARSEFMAEWRDDISSFIDRAAVEACVDPSVLERQPHAHAKYFAFVDPSGGSSDSMTLAIAHCEDDRVVVDCLREAVPPFSPQSVVEEFSETLRRYGVTEVVGDRYGGEWPRERFRTRGVDYKPSELTASDLFRELLPRLNTKSIALLDLPRAINQLASLERRVGRGREVIDHPRAAKNDLANAIAGVAWVAGDRGSTRYGDVMWGIVSPYGGRIEWTDPKAERRPH